MTRYGRLIEGQMTICHVPVTVACFPKRKCPTEAGRAFLELQLGAASPITSERIIDDSLKFRRKVRASCRPKPSALSFL